MRHVARLQVYLTDQRAPVFVRYQKRASALGVRNAQKEIDFEVSHDIVRDHDLLWPVVL